MKTFLSYRVSLALFLWITAAAVARAQWENLPQPFGGSVLQFEEDGADLYALTYGGIYKSKDAGGNWTLLEGSRHLGWSAVQLQVDKGILYVLTKAGTVERSSDAGAGWQTMLQRPYPINAPGEKLLRLFAAGDTLLVGSVLTIYHSTDRGTTWQKTVDNYAERYHDFAKIGNDLFAAHDWFIRKSSDGGQTWKQIFSAGYIFAGFTAVDTVLYALYDGYPRLIRSFDRGTTWDKIDADSIRFFLYHNETKDWLTGYGKDFYYASDYWCIHGGIQMFNSPDGGDEWSVTPQQGLKKHALQDVKALPGQLLAGTLQGVFRSADKGHSFSVSHAGMDATWVRQIGKTGSRWWTVTRQGTFSSDDEGLTWQLRFPGEMQDPCAWKEQLSFTEKRIFYQNGFDCSIVFSEDNGNTWQPLSIFHPLQCTDLVVTQAAAFIGWDGTFYKLGDDTDTPVPVTSPFPAEYNVLGSRNKIYVDDFNTSYVSYDAGISWDTLPVLMIDGHGVISFVLKMDDYRIWSYVQNIDDSGIRNYLYSYSFQTGAWQRHEPVDAATGDTIAVNDVLFIEKMNDIAWMGRRGKGLYYSVDEDNNLWHVFEPVLPHTHPSALFIDNNDLWVGTAGAGIYTMEVNRLLPGKQAPNYVLSPNPSPSEVKLTADVFFTENLHLRVFDAAGRLIRDTDLLPGNQWDFDFADLAAGLYFWQVQTPLGTTVLKWVKAR